MIPHRLTPDYPHWQAVLRLILDRFAYMEHRIDPPSSAHRLTVADMAAQARTGAVWVVKHDDAPIACLFAKPQDDALYLGKLAVADSHCGRGLLRLLVEVAEAEAHTRNLTQLELQTRIEPIENQATFARLGLAKTNETSHPGYDQPTTITMIRRVG